MLTAAVTKVSENQVRQIGRLVLILSMIAMVVYLAVELIRGAAPSVLTLVIGVGWLAWAAFMLRSEMFRPRGK